MDNTNEIIRTVAAIKSLKLRLRQLVYDMTREKPSYSTPVRKPKKALYQRKVKYRQVSPLPKRKCIRFTAQNDAMIMDKANKPKQLAYLLNRTIHSIYNRRAKLQKRVQNV